MHAVPTTPVSWEAVLSSGFLQHLQYVWQGGLQAKELCAAATCAAARRRARFLAPGARPTPGCERRRGRRGSAPGGRQASKGLSGAGGRAPVRREHVQSASHPYYG